MGGVGADEVLAPENIRSPFQLVCVRLDTIDPDELRELVVDAWRMCVPQKVSAAYEG